MKLQIKKFITSVASVFVNKYLPEDFNEQQYSEINEDLIGFNPRAHYVLFGKKENRIYKYDVPDDFLELEYKLLNKDLLSESLNLKLHYQLFGRNEGRSYNLILSSRDTFFNIDFSKPTALLFVHEASRTGAPMLGYNICNALLRSHNVFLILLGGGDLLDDFLDTGARVLNCQSIKYNEESLFDVIAYIKRNVNLDIAILNSVECAVPLPALRKLGIKSTTLVHEFASCYPKASVLFNRVEFFSDITIFSSYVLLNNAISNGFDFTKERVSVIPQPKSAMPQHYNRSTDYKSASHLGAANKKIVVGAGLVSYRKGVDIFLSLAKKVIDSRPNEYLFVWIGGGYEPEHDSIYSVYIKDQLEKSGLGSDFVFSGQVSNFNEWIAESDIFVLTSRLDPLPNVVLDAVDADVPVIFFKDTSGYDELFVKSEYIDHFAASYLDINSMADLILGITPELGRNIACSQSAAIQSLGRIDNYVSSILAA